MDQRLLVLRNARMIDGRDARVREQVTVTISGDTIVSISGEGGTSEDAQVIDLEGRTLLPGLIDAHYHVSAFLDLPEPLRGEEPLPREVRYFALANVARSLLAAGVTTVRDVGSYDDEQLVLRKAIRLGLCAGPRILTCGRILSATAPGGRLFGTMYREADGCDDMRRAVREQIRRGADFIKVMATGARSVVLEQPEPAQITRAELATVVDEAHRMGLRVAAHAEGLGGARLAVEEGVDTIEHGLSLHRAPDLLDRMAAQGIVLVPTLSTFHDVSETHADTFAPVLVEQAKRQREEAYRTLEAACRAGVTLAMGFDSRPAGDNALELVRMVEGGLSPMEGVVTATGGSARACGLQNVGTIEPGKVADLLIVDGDPLGDIRLLNTSERIWLVIQHGRPVASVALSAV
jgi:imidazolonepropionase-like amidohydrolase